MKWTEQIRDLFVGPGTIMERIDRQKTLILIFILVFAALLRFVFLIHFHEELVTRQEKGFFWPAWNWVHGHGLSMAADCPTSYRAPLYILFLIPFFALFGMAYAWPLGIAQLIMSVANVYLTYRIGKEWKSPRVGLLGAFFMAMYPYNLYHDTQFYVTFLFTFFLLLTVLGFLMVERTKSKKIAVMTGISIGFAMLAASGPMVFFAPLASFWLWRRWGSFKHAATTVLIIATCAVGVMSPWIIRNAIVHHAFVPLTDDGGRVFYKSYNPYIFEMFAKNIPADLTPGAIGSLSPMTGIGKTGCDFMGGKTEPELDDEWYGRAFAWIREQPGQAILLDAYKFVLFWRPWLWIPKDALSTNGSIILSAQFENWGYALSYGFLLIFGVVGYALETKEGRKRTSLFLLLAIAFSVMYSLTYPFSKYRIPFDFILALLSASACWRFIQYLEWRYTKKPELER